MVNAAMHKNCGKSPASILKSVNPILLTDGARPGAKAKTVALKIKGSQGQRRIEWVNPEHPFTAISPASEVHANHNEAQNSALRRRCSAYRRRQNLYAKRVEGLQRVLDVQRLVHNWVRPHWGLAKGTTPAMAMGFYKRPLTMHEILTGRGFSSILR